MASCAPRDKAASSSQLGVLASSWVFCVGLETGCNRHERAASVNSRNHLHLQKPTKFPTAQARPRANNATFQNGTHTYYSTPKPKIRNSVGRFAPVVAPADSALMRSTIAPTICAPFRFMSPERSFMARWISGHTSRREEGRVWSDGAGGERKTMRGKDDHSRRNLNMAWP